MSLGRRLTLTLLAAVFAVSGAGAIAEPAAAIGSAPRLLEQYRMDLGERADFVSQATTTWCIGASMQMMLNIIRPDNDASAETQEALMRLARSFRYRSARANESMAEVRGASARGWAAGLTELGAGQYRVTSAATLEAAVELVARAMRATGRPAGLVVWKGRHAWVVSGFEATVDPAATSSFDVTGLVVMDPWYPRVSRTYGRSPVPGATLTLAQLASDFLPYEHRNRTGRWTGRFVVVIPYDTFRVLDRLVHAA